MGIACIPWTGPIGNDGYGRVWIGSRGTLRKVRVHRLMWEAANGCPVPPGQFVLHRCDNRICINPRHLFVGSQADNVGDMMSKGRNKPPVGTLNGRARLTEAAILAIRQDSRPHKAIAADHGLHFKTVGRIKRRERWKDLPA